MFSFITLVQGIGLAYAAGLNLYAAVAVTGLAVRFGWIENYPTTIEPFGAWKWTLHGAQTGNSDDLGGQYEASNGVCSGVVLLELRVTSGANPFAPSVPGQVPNVIMNRGWLSGSGPGCPTSCGGSFLVNLKRL